ncbi:MAG: alpha/beta fold hydrolase [Myxococcota bacterium]
MPAPAPSRRGPHPVGVLQTAIASPSDPLDPNRVLPTEIWYPAKAGATERDDGAHPLGLRHRATTHLTPLDEGPRPLVVFSHGNSGLRQQSTFLTTHLASHGFVVAAPDHVGNTFSEMMALETDEARRDVHRRARTQRPHDLACVIESLVDGGIEADRRPPIDARRIGVAGHSYGGWTALKMPAREGRVSSVCCLAPASEPFVGKRAFEEDELPLDRDVATLVLAAEDDVLVDRTTSIEPLFARLGAHARLEWLDRADHFHFCDGLELLHKMHENTPRPNLPRPPRPFAELRPEGETHEWLNERVAGFFLESLSDQRRGDDTGDAAA